MSRQIKLCPKCGTENKPENASCANCYTALSTVPTTLSTKPEPTANPVAAAASPRPSAATPAAAVPVREMPPVGPMGGMPGGPIGGYTPPSRPEKKSGGGAIGWIMALLVIGGMAFAGWWFFMKPLAPDQVVQRFLEASKTNNFDQMKPYICQSDIDAMGGEEAMKQRMAATPPVESASKEELPKTGKVTYDGETTAVVEIIPAANVTQQMKALYDQGFQPAVVTVLEDGKWKVNGRQTQQRAGEELKRIMRQRMKDLGGRGFSLPGGTRPPRP